MRPNLNNRNVRNRMPELSAFIMRPAFNIPEYDAGGLVLYWTGVCADSKRGYEYHAMMSKDGWVYLDDDIYVGKYDVIDGKEDFYYTDKCDYFLGFSVEKFLTDNRDALIAGRDRSVRIMTKYQNRLTRISDRREAMWLERQRRRNAKAMYKRANGY